jgi:hypothetical protein
MFEWILDRVIFLAAENHRCFRLLLIKVKEMIMSRTVRWSIFLLVLLVFSAAAGFGQTSTSRITGTVTDPSGAVVPAASVTAINEATGITYTQVTTEGGLYSFPSLPIGLYTIKVELTGFKTAENKSNVLEINTPLVVNVHLQVGGTNEVVSVIGGYEKLETTSAKIGNIIEQKAIESLPLNGRNPLSLLTLEPGVVQRSYGGAGSGMSVNGSRDRAFNVTIDGIDANESSVPNPMSNMYRLNPDNVAEFRTITSNATAEEGRNSGANISVATRSGTNDFHGRVFEFFRNTALNSNEFFTNAMTAPDPRTRKAPRPDIKMNQFGIEGGGPIIKNKTFLFASYQNQRINTTQPIDQTYGLPSLYSPTLMSGIFRYWINDPTTPFVFGGQTITRNSPALVDGITGALKPGVPVCGGSITANCVASYNIFGNDPKGIGIDPTLAAIFKTYPTPNKYTTGDGLNTATYFWNPPASFKGPNLLFRVDHNFDAKNHVFVRWMFADYNTLQGDPLNGRPQVFPGFPPLGEVFRRTHGLSASYRRVISTNMVNEFTMGYSRFVYLFTQGEANPSWPDVGPFSFSSLTYPYINTPRTYRAVTTPQFIDNFSIIHGKHVFAFGANIRLYEHNDERGQPGGINVTPSLSFSSSRTPPGFVTPAVGSSTKAGIYSGDNSTLLGVINTLTGVPYQLSQNFLGDLNSDTFLPYKTGNKVTLWAEGHRLKQFNFFFQDEWKIRPNITLNYGLRWEFNLAPTEAGGRVYLPDKPVNGSQGPVTFVHADSWLKTNNLKALAPRLAIAWSPFGNQKTVIRSGYGIYFDPINSFMITAVAGKVPGLTTRCVSTVGGSTTPGCAAAPDVRIAQGFPYELTPPTTKPSSYLTLPAQTYDVAPALTTIDPYLKLPTVHQWNLSIQQELPGGFVAQGAYIGHRGTRLMRTYDLNQINVDSVLPSFLIMKANYLAGCKGDGTGCPTGVTGTPVPIVTSGAIPSTILGSVINSSTVYGYLTTNNVGSWAGRIEQYTLNLHLRPNQQFARITYLDSGGDSYYHAFQATLRKRYEKGLMMGLAYTYQKSIDDQSVDPVGATSGGALSTTGPRGATDIRNWRLDRARSDFDRTNVLSLNAVYELPVGRGKSLGNSFKGPLNHLLGGWSINGIYTWMSGEPFSVMTASYTLNNAHTSRAALVGSMPQMQLTQLPGVIGPSYFTDASAFKIPDAGQAGMGRNLFQAQPYWNLDLGIAKNFKISERTSIDFRMEMFNALNHPNFDNPRDASTGSPTITSSVFAQACCSTVAPPSTQTVIQTGESARIIQFALKISF